jgi:hypothetical protein
MEDIWIKHIMTSITIFNDSIRQPLHLFLLLFYGWSICMKMYEDKICKQI